MRIIKDPATRREDILNAASDLFIKEGYQNTTVESIVQKAGIAKGSFYNYFKSKEDVSEAIIERMANHIVLGAEELLTNLNQTPKQRLVNFINFTLQAGAEQNTEINPLAASQNNPSIKTMYIRACDDGGQLLIPIIVNTLKEGCDMGEFSVYNEYFTAVSIVGTFQKIYSAYFGIQHEDIKNMKQYVNDFMSKLLCTPFEE